MSEEDGQCVHYVEEEKQLQQIEETEKNLNQSQGVLWEASDASSVPNPWFISMPLMSNVRYQLDLCLFATMPNF